MRLAAESAGQGIVSTYAQDQKPSYSTLAPGCCDRRQNQYGIGRLYRRLSARIGKAKAVTATARKIAILFYNAMRFGLAYQDPGVIAMNRSIGSAW
ncbi:hypothetical protein ULF88_11630 [Halopseudomonas pachastrellae]|nr:hypothetical protein [Halopseudomonas pachastrellae]